MDPKRYLGKRLIKRIQDDCAPEKPTILPPFQNSPIPISCRHAICHSKLQAINCWNVSLSCSKRFTLCTIYHYSLMPEVRHKLFKHFMSINVMLCKIVLSFSQSGSTRDNHDASNTDTRNCRLWYKNSSQLFFLAKCQLTVIIRLNFYIKSQHSRNNLTEGL